MKGREKEHYQIVYGAKLNGRRRRPGTTRAGHGRVGSVHLRHPDGNRRHHPIQGSARRPHACRRKSTKSPASRPSNHGISGHQKRQPVLIVDARAAHTIANSNAWLATCRRRRQPYGLDGEEVKPATRSRRSPAKRRRPRTSPAVCRAWPNSSKPASRRTRPSSANRWHRLVR